MAQLLTSSGTISGYSNQFYAQMTQQQNIGALAGGLISSNQLALTQYQANKPPVVQRVGRSFLSKLREEIDNWHGPVLEF